MSSAPRLKAHIQLIFIFIWNNCKVHTQVVKCGVIYYFFFKHPQTADNGKIKCPVCCKDFEDVVVLSTPYGEEDLHVVYQVRYVLWNVKLLHNVQGPVVQGWITLSSG